MTTEMVYKILRAAEWQHALSTNVFAGSAADVRDGFIHLSTRDQLADTIARHFAGESGLIALEIAADRVNAALRWEPSRDGAMFPHLYSVLPLDAVVRTVMIQPSDNSASLSLSQLL
jgi:uncharacterized protein (DUF952 family)